VVLHLRKDVIDFVAGVDEHWRSVVSSCFRSAIDGVYARLLWVNAVEVWVNCREAAEHLVEGGILEHEENHMLHWIVGALPRVRRIAPKRRPSKVYSGSPPDRTSILAGDTQHHSPQRTQPGLWLPCRSALLALGIQADAKSSLRSPADLTLVEVAPYNLAKKARGQHAMTIKAAGLVQSTKCVFLLGAGFSAGYGLPVMNDFMGVARRRYFALKERSPGVRLEQYYTTMLEFQRECLASAWAFQRNWENIEELYTQADLRRLSAVPESKEGQDADELCKAIAWSIWDVYRSVEETEANDPLERIVSSIRSNNLEPVFITTNYDLVIEQSLQRGEQGTSRFHYAGFALPVGLYDEGILDSASMPPPVPPKNSIPIIKLHGSVNWFALNSQDQTHWTAYHVNTTQPTSVFSTFAKPDADTQAFLRFLDGQREAANPSPAIVPPMLGKSSLSPIIAKQWDAAISNLARAREIWIVGYSFPPTDAFMVRLLTEGIKDNDQLERIVVVDIQSYDKWKDRLDNLFPPPMRKQKVWFACASARTWLARLRDNYSHPDPHQLMGTLQGHTT